MPKLSNIVLGETENSEFVNDVFRVKNCYLVFDGEQAEDSLYGETFSHLQSCVDFYTLQRCILCYECIYCTDCYGLAFCRFCRNCSDSAFLLDCVGCRNCFGCTNLVKREFCFFNQQLTEAEYRAKVAEFDLGSHTGVELARSMTEKAFRETPKRSYRGVRNERCTGDNLQSCKDCYDCFDSHDLRDCAYCTSMLMGGHDCLDVNIWGDGLSLAYNSTCVGGGGEGIICCYFASHGVNRVSYSAFCSRRANNLFGCVGLRDREFCILNRRYSRTEYLALVPQIVSQMMIDGEWGEFFPPELSAFGYNESVANEYFPLSEIEAKQRGFLWSDYEAPIPQQTSLRASDLPDHIKSVHDDVLSHAIICEESGRPFRLTALELKFYRQRALPLPRCHPDVRHRRRFTLKNPRALRTSQCAKCGQNGETSFPETSGSLIYCERCYQEEFFQ